LASTAVSAGSLDIDVISVEENRRGALGAVVNGSWRIKTTILRLVVPFATSACAPWTSVIGDLTWLPLLLYRAERVGYYRVHAW
jgi:hypothetical protein